MDYDSLEPISNEDDRPVFLPDHHRKESAYKKEKGHSKTMNQHQWNSVNFALIYILYWPDWIG